jgi:outer membrane immunogenic protein
MQRVTTKLAALVVAVLSVGMWHSASAADLPVKAAPIVVAPAYNWSGWYAGINGGYAWGNADPRTSTVFSPTGYFATTSVPAIAATGAQRIKPSGGEFGGQLGYNVQFGSAVMGVETDIQWWDMKGSAVSSSLYPCCAPTGFTIASTVKADWLYTLRGRIGWASNNWLLYGTGGLAVTHIKAAWVFTDTFAAATESAALSDTRLGWTAGAGVEWGVSGPWSVKLEYLHTDFGRVSVASSNLAAFTPPINFPTNPFTHSVDLTSDMVRVGLNYRFRP